MSSLQHVQEYGGPLTACPNSCLSAGQPSAWIHGQQGWLAGIRDFPEGRIRVPALGIMLEEHVLSQGQMKQSHRFIEDTAAGGAC